MESLKSTWVWNYLERSEREHLAAVETAMWRAEVELMMAKSNRMALYRRAQMRRRREARWGEKA